MKKIMTVVALTFALCTVGSAALTLCANVAAANQNLAFYEANFTTAATGCQIDDKVFYGWSNGAITGGVNPANVLITPISTALNPGFMFNPNMSVGPGGIQDLPLHFTVATISGAKIIEDLSMGFAGGFTGNGIATINEFGCIGGLFAQPNAGTNCPAGNQVINLNVSNPPPVLFDIKFSNLTNLVDVFKDISVHGNTGSASISSFTQQFSEVPEVSSVLLLGTSFLLSSLAIRRKRASQ